MGWEIFRKNMTYNKKNIRNFSIIAHIDHGKSTLADRIIEICTDMSERDKQDQMLDSMDLERERGITIKLNTVKLTYDYKGETYVLNLIDTPGHVDFNYEVSRSLAACEGALLVVDASQGIEAQTLANTYLAMDQDLEILPVANKIDLPGADIQMAKTKLEDILRFASENMTVLSDKEGINIDDVIVDIIENVPSPSGDENKPLKALIFDSVYDSYQGVIMYVKIVDGKIEPGMVIEMMQLKTSFEVDEIGYLEEGKRCKTDIMEAGEVGYIIAGIKDVKDARVGDTITNKDNPAKEPLPGYRKVVPMVYSGFYPAEGEVYSDLRDALDKLQVNDASLVFQSETSEALGFGFRVGFLGLLHMEIVQERLDREFDLDIIATAPSVIYKINLNDGTSQNIQNPSDFPDPSDIASIEEPMIKANIMTPKEYIGQVMELCQNKRGRYINMEYIDENRVSIIYEMPLNEVIYDFFDALKSNTRGYASLDYEIIGYEESRLVRLDILVNGEMVDALSIIVHEDKAYERARKIVERLKDEIPRHQFQIPIQAAIGGKIIARETVKALRKDVLSKCYGGDISRKKKLLEKQKEGKKRMRQIGNVEIPQEAFLSVLKYDDEK